MLHNKNIKINRFIFLSIIVIFVLPNVFHLDVLPTIASFIVCIISVLLLSRESLMYKSHSVYLPLNIFIIGILIFHAGWGIAGEIEVKSHQIQNTNVTWALCITVLTIISCAIGIHFAIKTTSLRPWYKKNNVNEYIFIGLLCLFLGFSSEIWALQNNLIGYDTDAFGVDYSRLSNPFSSLIGAVQSLIGIGQIILLSVYIKYYWKQKILKKKISNFILLIIISSIVFDFTFRIQSAAKAGLMIGFLSVLITLYEAGFKKIVYVSTLFGAIIFVTLISPLANMMRYDHEYRTQNHRGEFYIPNYDQILMTYTNSYDSIIESLSRLNQNTILAYVIQRQDEGLPILGGGTYSSALVTLIPRMIIPERKNKPLEYDRYTGFFVLSNTYNNWGIHTEAFLNFGVWGVIVVTALGGYLWQKIFLMLIKWDEIIGWAIASSVLLPTIFRSSEYGFIMSIIFLVRITIYSIICIKLISISGKIFIKTFPKFHLN